MKPQGKGKRGRPRGQGGWMLCTKTQKWWDRKERWQMTEDDSEEPLIMGKAGGKEDECKVNMCLSKVQTRVCIATQHQVCKHVYMSGSDCYAIG